MGSKLKTFEQANDARDVGSNDLSRARCGMAVLATGDGKMTEDSGERGLCVAIAENYEKLAELIEERRGLRG